MDVPLVTHPPSSLTVSRILLLATARSLLLLGLLIDTLLISRRIRPTGPLDCLLVVGVMVLLGPPRGLARFRVRRTNLLPSGPPPRPVTTNTSLLPG